MSLVKITYKNHNPEIIIDGVDVIKSSWVEAVHLDISADGLPNLQLDYVCHEVSYTGPAMVKHYCPLSVRDLSAFQDEIKRLVGAWCSNLNEYAREQAAEEILDVVSQGFRKDE